MARIGAGNSDLPVGSCVFATAGSLWGCWLFEVGKCFHRLLQVRHFFFYFRSGSEFGSQETSCACNCGNLVVLEAF